MGQAILHVHTTYSDGTATVDQILNEVERQGQIDVISFTDHDDVRAYWDACRWKARNPNSRVQPLWGIELTAWRFKHLMVYCATPPTALRPFRKFLPLDQAVQQARDLNGTVIVPHVDAFWIGLGRKRLVRLAGRLGIAGFELLNPYQGSERSVARLRAMNESLGLTAVGGSDAHHLEDLFEVIVEFPGDSPGDLDHALRDRTAHARWGWSGPAIPLRRQLEQHTRALLFHPAEQIHDWVRGRAAKARQD